MARSAASAAARRAARRSPGKPSAAWRAPEAAPRREPPRRGRRGQRARVSGGDRASLESLSRRREPSSGDADDGAAGQLAAEDRVERALDLVQADLARDRLVELRRPQVVGEPAPELRAL